MFPEKLLGIVGAIKRLPVAVVAGARVIAADDAQQYTVFAGGIAGGIAWPPNEPPSNRRQLRHAIEANRFLSGDWPRGLEATDRTGLLGRDSLAPDTGAPYYYSIRENQIVLLTPEH